MPKAYVIFTEDIHDREGMRHYSKASTPSVVSSGARVLCVDANPLVLEGEWHGTRTVMLEFDSVEDARAWYESEEYQKVKPLRQAASNSNGVILSGITAPPPQQ
jgi:uncharacterized protein (DUF1330 family)